ncbi:MAG: NAD-dependent epimerase/dehydratase family protein [Bdellovibrionales bacterium]
MSSHPDQQLRVLITGATGYVGARLSHSLLTKGMKVRMTSRKPLPPLPVFEGAEWASLDFASLNKTSLSAALKNVDAVVHLAALNDQQCRENPELALRVNGFGTQQLLEAATENGVSQFLYFSTAHVYGTPLVGKFSEDSPTQPMSHYTITHRVAEDYVLASPLKKKQVFRLSNAIGAPLLPETNCWMLLVNDLCRQAVKTGRLVLKTHGLQLRNFLSLAAVEDATFQTLQTPHSPEKIVNLVGMNKSIREMAELIHQKAQKILNQSLVLEMPLASANEQEQALESRLEIQSRLPLDHSLAEAQLSRAVEETLAFCQKYKDQI